MAVSLNRQSKQRGKEVKAAKSRNRTRSGSDSSLEAHLGGPTKEHDMATIRGQTATTPEERQVRTIKAKHPA